MNAGPLALAVPLVLVLLAGCNGGDKEEEWPPSSSTEPATPIFQEWGLGLEMYALGSPRHLEAEHELQPVRDALQNLVPQLLTFCGGQPHNATWLREYDGTPLLGLTEALERCEGLGADARREGRSSWGSGSQQDTVNRYKATREAITHNLGRGSLADHQVLAWAMQQYQESTGPLYRNSVTGEPLNETQLGYDPEPVTLARLQFLHDFVRGYEWSAGTCTVAEDVWELTEAHRLEVLAVAEPVAHARDGRNRLTLWGEANVSMPAKLRFHEELGWWPMALAYDAQLRWSIDYYNSFVTESLATRQEALWLAMKREADGVYLWEQFAIDKNARWAAMAPGWEDYGGFALTFMVLDALQWPVEWMECTDQSGQ